ncbi:phosphotransferase [Notoacmeibacter ruber]|uniref:Phosphotransferase family protein n=1 Tax=Notoacmeibacter ruber TaxID=2670375 RepID=A0A3L7JDF1_9HYPH|nr:phosphotransferase [Notoacmeibacter ruber]RLQ88484.1 phosphotransferase family protein [Notoacmeibacter ruber]
MSQTEEIDKDSIETWMQDHVEGFEDFRSIEKITAGQSNPTYRINAGSGRYVLRAKPPGELLKSAHQVDREYRVISALSKTDVPVPKVYALSAEGDESPIGRQFYIMDFLEGRIFWDPILPDATSNDERAAIYDSMNRTLAALHSVDIDAVDLSDFGKPGSYFARQFSRWTKQYKASETGTIPEMDHLMDWLGKNEPADDGQVSLVHGDYRLDNMIFEQDGTDVIALLDWELSTLGHPFADLSYQCMQWRLPHDTGFKGLGGVERSDYGLPSERDYVTRYCDRRGIDTPDNWRYYIAFSFFRLAAILQGVYKRALDGNAANPERGKEMGKAVPLLAQLAVQSLDEDEPL